MNGPGFRSDYGIPTAFKSLRLHRFLADFIADAKSSGKLVGVVTALVLAHIYRRYLSMPIVPCESPQPGSAGLEVERQHAHSSNDLPLRLDKSTDYLQSLVGRSFSSEQTPTVWDNLYHWLYEHLAAQAIGDMEAELGNGYKLLDRFQRLAYFEQCVFKMVPNSIAQRLDRLFTIYCRGLARTIVNALKIHTMSREQMECLLGEYSQPHNQVAPIDITSMFAGPYLRIPSNPIVQTLINSLQNAPSMRNWVRNAEGYTYQQCWEGNRALVQVSYHIDTAADRLCWESMQPKGDLMADVYLICLGQWMLQAGIETEPAYILSDSVLRVRGIKPKIKAGYPAGWRTKEKEFLKGCFEFYNKLNIKTANLTTYPLGGKPHKASFNGRVFTYNLMQPQTLKYHPGEIGILTMNSYRLQNGYLSRAILTYDYYRQKYEKRLGRYLSFQWAIRKNHATFNRPWSIRTLLESVDLGIDPRHPDRTRKRFEQALNRLQSDGVISLWAYSQGREQDLPAKKWVQHWLRWKVQIIPPPDLYPDSAWK